MSFDYNETLSISSQSQEDQQKGGFSIGRCLARRLTMAAIQIQIGRRLADSIHDPMFFSAARAERWQSKNLHWIPWKSQIKPLKTDFDFNGVSASGDSWNKIFRQINRNSHMIPYLGCVMFAQLNTCLSHFMVVCPLTHWDWQSDTITTVTSLYALPASLAHLHCIVWYTSRVSISHQLSLFTQSNPFSSALLSALQFKPNRNQQPAISPLFRHLRLITYKKQHNTTTPQLLILLVTQP